jgi:hypothetical protein
MAPLPHTLTRATGSEERSRTRGSRSRPGCGTAATIKDRWVKEDGDERGVQRLRDIRMKIRALARSAIFIILGIFVGGVGVMGAENYIVLASSSNGIGWTCEFRGTLNCPPDLFPATAECLISKSKPKSICLELPTPKTCKYEGTVPVGDPTLLGNYTITGTYSAQFELSVTVNRTCQTISGTLKDTTGAIKA